MEKPPQPQSQPQSIDGIKQKPPLGSVISRSPTALRSGFDTGKTQKKPPAEKASWVSRLFLGDKLPDELEDNTGSTTGIEKNEEEDVIEPERLPIEEQIFQGNVEEPTTGEATPKVKTQEEVEKS